ncbi:MAG TPA: hypothetical protein PLF99_05185, partial [Tenuifilaceae bacterium]|nr:hypothetical protein [Tenuifilaceae bacterium]
ESKPLSSIIAELFISLELTGLMLKSPVFWPIKVSPNSHTVLPSGRRSEMVASAAHQPLATLVNLLN